MRSQFGFAIIGAGAISKTHAEQIRSLENARLVAVADVDEERARAFGERSEAEWYTDYRAVIERPDVDVVSIVTPSGTHGDIAMYAAKTGKHVIVEKPLDVTLEKARQVVEVCRAAGVKFGVISQHRFDEGTIQLKSEMDSGKLGKMVLVEAAVNWYRTQAYYDRADWAGTWAMDGGGVLMIQALHTIDVMQYLVGDIDGVSAYAATAAHDRIEVEDVAVVAVRFKSVALGTIAATTSADPEFPVRLEVFGTEGTGVIERNRLTHLFYRNGQVDPKTEHIIDWAESGDRIAAMQPQAENSHRRQFRDFIDAIMYDREPLVNGEEGLKPMEIIKAIYKSAKTGRSVTIEEIRT